MPSGVLHGRDHTGGGKIAAIAEGRVAVALSRGGAPKRYAHKDPNEDGAAFVSGDGGDLLVVADAHAGREAAEIAVDHLVERFGPQWTTASAPPLPWPELARSAVGELHAAILESAARGGNPESRTTLTFALVRPGEDLLAWASVGDSHVFHVAEAETSELTPQEPERMHFLGSPSRTPETLEIQIASRALGATRALVLVTDGISEHGIGVDYPCEAVAAAAARAELAKPELRALVAARHLLEQALAAHRRQSSGDNVATALYWAVGSA
jgi:serine/threonine protein phosphatase PrpC